MTENEITTMKTRSPRYTILFRECWPASTVALAFATLAFSLSGCGQTAGTDSNTQRESTPRPTPKNEQENSSHASKTPATSDAKPAVPKWPWPIDGEVGLVAEFSDHSDAEPTGGHRCHCVAWSPNQRLLASGGADGTIVVRDIVEDKVKQWRPTEDRIRSLAFSPGNKYLLSDDNTTGVRFWSLPDFEELGSRGNAAHAIFLEDEKVLSSMRNSGVIGTWSPATTGTPKKFADAGKTVFSLDVDATQNLIATASWKGTLQVRKISSGDLVREWAIDGREVAISANAENILVGVGEDSSVRLLSTDSGDEVWRRTGIICCDADFIADERVVLTGGWSDKMPCVAWDVERGRAIHHFGKAKAIGGLAVSPNGRFMATASTDGFVRIFRLPDSDQIEASLDEVDRRAQSLLAAAKRSRSFDQWISRLGEAINLDPGLAEAYYLRADIKQKVAKTQGNHKLLEEAAEDYAMALRWDDSRWRWHFKAAVVDSDLGRLEFADQRYRRTIELIRGPGEKDPEDDETQRFLAWSYLNNCDVLLRMNRARDAIAFGDGAVRVADGMPMAHHNRGRAYEANRMYGEAIAAYERALELGAGNFGNPHIGLANICYNLGELDASYRHQTQAMLSTGIDPGRLQMLATIQLRRGRYENALGQLAPLMAMPNVPANAHLLAGKVWAAAGELENAETQFRKALEMEPGLARTHVFLGDIQLTRGEKEAADKSFETALTTWNELLETDSDNPSLWNSRGAFQVRRGEMDKARDDFLATIESADRYFWAVGNLAYAY